MALSVKKKSPRGAPTKYNKDYARQAEVACSEGGFTNPKLAKLFGVATSTIGAWMKDYADFSDAIKRGKEAWDNIKVEDALLKRSLGYKYNEITKEPDEQDPSKLRITKIIKKEVVPDTTAQIFWLTNRNRSKWKRNTDLEHKINADDELVELFKSIAGALPD